MYIADLHIHSKYSRATSPSCVPEQLDLWARKKGIDLLGTGDFTHPSWRAELAEKLIPCGNGLFTLADAYRIQDGAVQDSRMPRFVISGEISTIYKKNDRVRKVHHLILLPGLEEADTLSRKLESIGNIHSDGRPILGLDSRDLLEITMEACPDAMFIPAHIWTPHFSLFGAFSGFDTIEECFEDMTPHIHALETGLSSDPAMNWRCSALDKYHLISNSDAHSPAKLGREANLLNIELSYQGLSHALKEGIGLAGTIEFFPEEGKYHYDGHRKCGLCLTPSETQKFGGKCPVCGRKITIGVQHRIEQLADREEGFNPLSAPAFESMVPLPEVIRASSGLSPAKAALQYETILHELGTEFYILREAPLEDIRHTAGACVAEGISRLRSGRVERIPGYDGEYGKIRLLDEDERNSLNGQMSIFTIAEIEKPTVCKENLNFSETGICSPCEETPNPAQKKKGLLEALNPRQTEAVTAQNKRIAVIAGPGTGKTRTLVAKIVYLTQRKGIKPSEITAVTFTNKAAAEMRLRLEQELGKRAARAMTIGTFHAVCLTLLKESGITPVLLEENDALDYAENVIEEFHLSVSPRDFLREISRRKNESDSGLLSDEAAQYYDKLLNQAGVMDLDDLLLQALQLWERGKPSAKQKRRFSYLLADEFQDCNPIQYRLILAWMKQNLLVIGDPDQAIYGFRGADAACFNRLRENLEDILEIRLTENYRSTPEILGCARAVIEQSDGCPRTLHTQCAHGESVQLLTASSDLAEAIFIAKKINQTVGGIDMLDAYGFARPNEQRRVKSFSEIAVLYRTHRQAKILENCLHKEGIPYTVTGSDDLLADNLVRSILSFFRFLLEPRDLSAARSALRGVCEVSEPECEGVTAKLTADKMQPEEIISEAIHTGGNFAEWVKAYYPRVRKDKPFNLLRAWSEENGFSASENVQKLMNIAVTHKHMDSFIQSVLFGKDADIVRSSGSAYTSDAVTLMTLHACKGLEFPVVFLCGAQKGVIPLESKRYPVDLEEERRLFYVGMTRAQEELYVLTRKDEPSPFLQNIPEDLVSKGETAPPRPQGGKQMTLFD